MEARILALEEDLQTLENQPLPPLVVVNFSEEEEPRLRAQPVTQKQQQQQQPMAPEGQISGPLQMTEFTRYHPRTQAELVELGKQFRQKPGEPLAAWILLV